MKASKEEIKHRTIHRTIDRIDRVIERMTDRMSDRQVIDRQRNTWSNRYNRTDITE